MEIPFSSSDTNFFANATPGATKKPATLTTNFLFGDGDLFHQQRQYRDVCEQSACGVNRAVKSMRIKSW